MIAITGVPGSGKSTICRELNLRGMHCVNAMEIPGAAICAEGEEVDLECLSERLATSGLESVVEGHFAHLLGCTHAIICERSEASVRETLEDRGYPMEKVEENIDALLSDSIYQEALESLPSTRIHRLQIVEGEIGQAADQCIELINRWRNKH